MTPILSENLVQQVKLILSGSALLSWNESAVDMGNLFCLKIATKKVLLVDVICLLYLSDESCGLAVTTTMTQMR